MDRESAESAGLELAREIASMSPVAVQGSKVNLLYSRDHTVEEGLEYAVSGTPLLGHSYTLCITHTFRHVYTTSTALLYTYTHTHS